MQQRHERQVVGRVILALPEDFWLVRQGIPYSTKAALQQCRKPLVLRLLGLRSERVEREQGPAD